VSEEVKLHCPARKDGVVTVTMDCALKAQPPKKSQRVIKGPAGQYRNSDVGLLHDVLDVQGSASEPDWPTSFTRGYCQVIPPDFGLAR
jgi:hypothetical protein